MYLHPQVNISWHCKWGDWYYPPPPNEGAIYCPPVCWIRYETQINTIKCASLSNAASILYWKWLNPEITRLQAEFGELPTVCLAKSPDIEAVALLTWRNNNAIQFVPVAFTYYMTHIETHILRIPVANQLCPSFNHADWGSDIHQKGEVFSRGLGAGNRCCSRCPWHQAI